MPRLGTTASSAISSKGTGGGADEQAYGQGQLQGSMVQVCKSCRYDEQKGE
jgi:hypothetical protein